MKDIQTSIGSAQAPKLELGRAPGGWANNHPAVNVLSTRLDLAAWKQSREAVTDQLA